MGVSLIPTCLGGIIPYIQHPKQSGFFSNEGLVVTPGGDDCILGGGRSNRYCESSHYEVPIQTLWHPSRKTSKGKAVWSETPEFF